MGVLGKNLRAARKSRELTQEDLAQRTGIQAGEISRIERGKRDPQVSTVERLAQGLDIEADELLRPR